MKIRANIFWEDQESNEYLQGNIRLTSPTVSVWICLVVLRLCVYEQSL